VTCVRTPSLPHHGAVDQVRPSSRGPHAHGLLRQAKAEQNGIENVAFSLTIRPGHHSVRDGSSWIASEPTETT